MGDKTRRRNKKDLNARARGKCKSEEHESALKIFKRFTKHRKVVNLFI